MQSEFNRLCRLYADREYTGKQINLNNVSHSKIRNLEIVGETKEIGEGEKSPDNPYLLVGSKPSLKVNEQNINCKYELNNIDDIADTYNPLTGVYVQRVKKLTLQGTNTEIWRMPATDENNAVFALTLKDMYYSHNVLCSILEPKGTAGGYAAALRSGVGVYRWTGDGNVYLYFVVPLSVASTKEEWFKYLQNNLVQVCYRLADPITTIVNIVNVTAFIPNTTMVLEDSNNLGSIKTTLQTKGQ